MTHARRRPPLHAASAAVAALGAAAALAWPAAALAVDSVRDGLMDHSTRQLIDAEAAKKLMAENIPAKVWQVYPTSKYSFVSQVEGGITPTGTCVVVARVMLITLTPAMKAPLFRPQKTATAFDAVAAQSPAQCSALARVKLKEATLGIVSALVKT